MADHAGASRAEVSNYETVTHYFDEAVDRLGIAEDLAGLLLAGHERRSRKGDEGGVWESGPHVGGEGVVLAPLAGVGALLLGTAYLLFTMALVGLVVAFFRDNPYRWFFAFAAVAVLWTVLGGIAAYFAKREFELKGLMPRKTIEVLKEDKIWIQAEAKNQL